MNDDRLYLYLRLDGPLQAWGGVALDPVRPTKRFPTLSALAGLLASAMGWTYRDGKRTTALQDALDYAVLEVRRPQVLVDYQTADLDGIGTAGWTRWGVEKRAGSAASGTQILWKDYLADGEFLVALGVDERSPVSVTALKEALVTPARPLFLGRKSCPPASPIYVGETGAASAYDALLDFLADRREGISEIIKGGAPDEHPLRIWYQDGRGPVEGEPESVWDRRDFSTDRFGGERTVRSIRTKLRESAGPAQ